MEDKICESQITGEYVARYLKQVFGDQAILQSFDAELIGVGDGVVSKIIRLNLNWATKDHLPESIIVKAPSVEKLVNFFGDGNEAFGDASSQWVPVAHNVECAVYEIFKQECPVKIAECYAIVPITDGSPGMLIMENLSQKAGIVPNFLDGLNYQQVLASITEIARLQGWSLTTNIDWRSQLPSFRDLADIMRSYLAPVIPALKSVKETYPAHFGSIDLQKLSKVLEWESYSGIMTEHEQYMQDVLAHGDFHKNNIMFEKYPDGSISDRLAAVIDFQGVMKSSPTYDIAHLLTFSVTPEFRERHEMDILRGYFDTVKSIAGDKFEVSFDHVHHMYRRHLAIETLFLVAWTPQMLAFAVKSEGDQKVDDTKKFLDYAKKLYDHSVKIFD